MNGDLRRREPARSDCQVVPSSDRVDQLVKLREWSRQIDIRYYDVLAARRENAGAHGRTLAAIALEADDPKPGVNTRARIEKGSRTIRRPVVDDQHLDQLETGEWNLSPGINSQRLEQDRQPPILVVDRYDDRKSFQDCLAPPQ
jgi:hypothetical protein